MQQKENVVVKNQVILSRGHYLWAASRKVVIRDLIKWIQDLQRLSLQSINNIRGRFQIKFGMTTLFNNGGFTLIELLVVVLIIGILAAVAVPQYKKAVIKSRVATILPVLSSIIQAQEVYYLANGQYTDNAELMDLQPPANCAKVENDTEGGTWKCGNDFLLDIDAGRVYANYCPKYNNSYTVCKTKREFAIAFGAAHILDTTYPGPNSKKCSFSNESSTYGEEICRTLGKPVPDTTDVYEMY